MDFKSDLGVFGQGVNNTEREGGALVGVQARRHADAMDVDRINLQKLADGKRLGDYASDGLGDNKSVIAVLSSYIPIDQPERIPGKVIGRVASQSILLDRRDQVVCRGLIGD